MTQMTGYEFTYRAGRGKIRTMRRFGTTVEDATARFQKAMDAEFAPKTVAILSVQDVGLEVVRDNLPTPARQEG
jgi:hypothetical protein